MTTYSPSHPIVFVFDFSNENMVVPEYDPGSVTSANESCVSIRTIADVDGDVTASLIGTLPDEEVDMGKEVFHGVIQAPSRKIALITSQNERLVEIDVNDTKADIRVFVDEEEHPSRIWVVAT